MTRSLLFNYSAQIYSAFVGVAVIPLYISRMGIDGFGLFGFFIMLQAWAQILDAGVGGSLSRRTAIVKENSNSFKKFLHQFYIIVTVFLITALIFFISLSYSSNYVASNWLQSNLDIKIIQLSLISMFASLSFRYLSGPFRSGLVGLEKHGTLSVNSVFFMTLKFPLGFLALELFDNSLSGFFLYQSAVSLLELLSLGFLFYLNCNSKLNSLECSNDSISNEKSLKSLLLFSAQLSFLSVTWIVVTQIDKLLLSKFLPLGEFGYYSLAVSISSVITILAAPLSQLLMPRLSSMASKKLYDKYLALYIKSFKLFSILVITLSLLMFFFSNRIIFIWTGSDFIANETLYFVIWLSLGNAVATLMNFIFILQYSIGKLKMHVVVYGLYSFILIPCSFYITLNFKAEGSVIFWFLHNLLFFLLWGSYVHNKYIEGSLYYVWFKILFPSFLLTFIFFSIVSALFKFTNNNLFDLFILALVVIANFSFLFGYFKIFKRNDVECFQKLRIKTNFKDKSMK